MNNFENLLIELEQKYSGGIYTTVRTKKSKKDIKLKHTGGDRMKSKNHNYSYDYNKFLEPLQNKKINLAEVGILKGSGLAIWSDMFHKDSRIIGFDIDTDIFNNNLNNLIELGAFTKSKPEIFTMDQWNDNTIFLKDILKNDKLDVVIDDGCHANETVLKTFKSFLPYLNKKFIYFVEDNWKAYSIFKSEYPQFNVYHRNKMIVITN